VPSPTTPPPATGSAARQRAIGDLRYFLRERALPGGKLIAPAEPGSFWAIPARTFARWYEAYSELPVKPREAIAAWLLGKRSREAAAELIGCSVRTVANRTDAGLGLMVERMASWRRAERASRAPANPGDGEAAGG
jgi:hypothetical protein